VINAIVSAVEDIGHNRQDDDGEDSEGVWCWILLQGWSIPGKDSSWSGKAQSRAHRNAAVLFKCKWSIHYSFIHSFMRSLRRFIMSTNRSFCILISLWLSSEDCLYCHTQLMIISSILLFRPWSPISIIDGFC